MISRRNKRKLTCRILLTINTTKQQNQTKLRYNKHELGGSYTTRFKESVRYLLLLLVNTTGFESSKTIRSHPVQEMWEMEEQMWGVGDTGVKSMYVNRCNKYCVFLGSQVCVSVNYTQSFYLQKYTEGHLKVTWDAVVLSCMWQDLYLLGFCLLNASSPVRKNRVRSWNLAHQSRWSFPFLVSVQAILQFCKERS